MRGRLGQFGEGAMVDGAGVRRAGSQASKLLAHNRLTPWVCRLLARSSASAGRRGVVSPHCGVPRTPDTGTADSHD